MDTLITYHSEHHHNTKKIAVAIGQILKAKIIIDSQLKNPDMEPYNLIGFGSGVYNGKFHRNMYEIIKQLKNSKGKKSLVFSTTGSLSYGKRANDLFRKELANKGFKVLGDFTCLGYDTAMGSEGINHGRPNSQDIENAQKFAQNL